MKKMHAKQDVYLPKQKNRVFLLNFPSTCKTLLNSSINMSLIKKCFNLIEKELFPTLINASDNLWGPPTILKKQMYLKMPHYTHPKWGSWSFPLLNVYQLAKNQSDSQINPLIAKPTKWSNILKQFVGNLPTNCLSVIDHFAGCALKGLSFYLLLIKICISYHKIPSTVWSIFSGSLIFYWLISWVFRRVK